jgi:hypothetical protein
MEYVTIENGIITGHFDAVSIPPEGTPIDDRFVGVVGDPAAKYDWDNGGATLSEAEQVAIGILEDNRGIWYECADQGMFEITEIGVPLPEGVEVTQEAPLSPFDEWDGSQWVLNQATETLWLNQRAIDMAQDAVDVELAEATNAIIRWMEDRFTVPQTDFDFVDSMTDIADVKTAVTGILNKLNLDAGDLTFITSWKTKYDAWIAAKNA